MPEIPAELLPAYNHVKDEGMTAEGMRYTEDLLPLWVISTLLVRETEVIGRLAVAETRRDLLHAQVVEQQIRLAGLKMAVAECNAILREDELVV